MAPTTSPARVSVVTGGGSGIGRAVALALAAEGDSVVVAGRRLEALEDTVALGAPGRLSAVSVDIRDDADVGRLFDAAIERHGRVDLLFNNAGVGSPAVPLDELDPAAMRAVIETNVIGALLCTRHAFRVMRSQDPQGGRIINNGSVSADRPRPFSAPYTTSKHAITGLTKSIILDGRRFGITSGQIDVGNARTELTARMDDGVLQADFTRLPEPLIDVDHVARAVVYMASLPPSANAPFVTVMATGMPLYGRG